MRLFVYQLPLSSPPAYVPVDSGHYNVPTVLQLQEIVAECVPDFREAAHCLRDREEAVSHTLFHLIASIHLLNVLSRELQCSSSSLSYSPYL